MQQSLECKNAHPFKMGMSDLNNIYCVPHMHSGRRPGVTWHRKQCTYKPPFTAKHIEG
jgi:hypothetical protein